MRVGIHAYHLIKGSSYSYNFGAIPGNPVHEIRGVISFLSPRRRSDGSNYFLVSLGVAYFYVSFEKDNSGSLILNSNTYFFLEI